LVEYKHLHSQFAPRTSEDSPHTLPPKFSGDACRPVSGGNSESTVTVLPSTAVFFTVLTVAHYRWYRPTLLATQWCWRCYTATHRLAQLSAYSRETRQGRQRTAVAATGPAARH